MVTFNLSQPLLKRLNDSNSSIFYWYLRIRFTNHGSSVSKTSDVFQTGMPTFWQNWIQTPCSLWNATRMRFDVYITVYHCWLNNYYIVPFGGATLEGVLSPLNDEYLFLTITFLDSWCSTRCRVLSGLTL